MQDFCLCKEHLQIPHASHMQDAVTCLVLPASKAKHYLSHKPTWDDTSRHCQQSDCAQLQVVTLYAEAGWLW